MTAFRFIHASDLHLGRRFASVPQDADGNIRGRLMEARHAAIGRIAEAARSHGASDILLAGDTFDTATPSAALVRQALVAMGADPSLRWWMLPGNHDNLRDAEPLWETIRRDAPPNVHALCDETPVGLGSDVALLPCPVTHRAAGRDPTDHLDGILTPVGTIRLGLAHGGVTDFSDGRTIIPPDRDRTARLDYLALGDWHGRLAIGPRVQFSGSPEQDRFRHDRRGACLAVTLPGPGAAPEIAEVETGTFLWQTLALPLAAGLDPGTALDAILPAAADRRDALIHVTATGWASLSQRADLAAAIARFAPDFGLLELRDDALGTLYEAGDLDHIARDGALRDAADALRDAAGADGADAHDRATADAALARLYAYMREIDA